MSDNCSCGVGDLTSMVGGSHHRTCAIYGDAVTDPVDLQRVLELDQAATPDWAVCTRHPTPQVETTNGRVICKMAFPDDEANAQCAAFYRHVAPAMARTLLELRERAGALKAYAIESEAWRIEAEMLVFAVLEATGGEA